MHAVMNGFSAVSPADEVYGLRWTPRTNSTRSTRALVCDIHVAIGAIHARVSAPAAAPAPINSAFAPALIGAAAAASTVPLAADVTAAPATTRAPTIAPLFQFAALHAAALAATRAGAHVAARVADTAAPVAARARVLRARAALGTLGAATGHVVHKHAEHILDAIVAGEAYLVGTRVARTTMWPVAVLALIMLLCALAYAGSRCATLLAEAGAPRPLGLPRAYVTDMLRYGARWIALAQKLAVYIVALCITKHMDSILDLSALSVESCIFALVATDAVLLIVLLVERGTAAAATAAAAWHVPRPQL